MTEFRRVHIAVLFAVAYALKSLWKHVMGAHLVLVVVCVGFAYIGKLRQPKDPLEVALTKLQEEDDALAAASSDPTRTFVRPTHFIVPEEERNIFMPRHSKYSSLLGGTREQRKKFIQKKKKELREAPAETLMPSIQEDPQDIPKRRQPRAFQDN
ncbi:hypothetical protein THRCLA_03738 [Thraustotheca clavata]|uniref:Uncharacterized protein n=1 Tax=Thraustotheca clavata TaxID=74557 RepID=A0A1W0A1A3_9STRA|nr:hypothetical protein THRCLA_03738 [Thraustotheca clavata]